MTVTIHGLLQSSRLPRMWFCKKTSHLAMLSGVRYKNPVVLFAPCFILTNGASTVLALFLWSVERQRRLPLCQQGCCLTAVFVSRTRWFSWGDAGRQTLWAFPGVLHSGKAMTGLQIPASDTPRGEDWRGV